MSTDQHDDDQADDTQPSGPAAALGAEDLAQLGYAAYAQHTGGKNYRGEDMPTWSALPEPQHGAWLAAASAIALHAQGAATNTLPLEPPA
jgi:hypothetical protein